MPLGNSARCIQDHFGCIVDFLKGRLEGGLRGEATAASNGVELLLGFVRELAVDWRGAGGVWGGTGGHLDGSLRGGSLPGGGGGGVLV